MKIEDTKIYKGCVIRLRNEYTKGYYFWIYRNGKVVEMTKHFENENDILIQLSLVVTMIDEGEI